MKMLNFLKNSSLLVNYLVNRKILRFCSASSKSPRIIKIESPEFSSVKSKDLMDLVNIFSKHEYELRIAGGAVRDLLQGIRPHDIDLATTATPDQMLSMFEIEKIRIFNLNGLRHGTVSVRINDRANFEITTLRVDVLTNGRHAKVEFIKDWALDANRRDLTINSMFLDFQGNVYDYFNGIEDLKKRIVRFVGKPDTRVQEDYLRIMRFFRFFSRVAEPDSKFDEESYNAIKRNCSGLQKISGERIWEELRKIMVQKYVDKIINAFYDTDVAIHIGLPKSPNMNEFHKVYSVAKYHSPKPLTLLSALLNNEEDLNILHKRLKFSNDDLFIGSTIMYNRNKVKINTQEPEFPLKYYEIALNSSHSNLKRPMFKNEAIELMKYQGESDYIPKINAYELPVFPIQYQDLRALLPLEIKEKESASRKIFSRLKDMWVDSYFKMSKDEIERYVYDEEFLSQFKPKSKSKKK